MPDVRLQPDRDVPELGTEWAVITGAGEAAQNIIEAINTPIGSLPWDREAGSELPRWLNGTNPPERIIGELRRVALTIPGLIPQSIVATYNRRTRRYTLSFASAADGSTSTVLVDG